MIEQFIRTLSVAAKQVAAYPSGHPAVAASLASVLRAFSDLIASGGAVVLGVARDGLVYGERKLGGGPARELAHALYQGDVAMLRLEPALDASDLHALLRCVGSEGRRGGGRLAEELAAAGARHIHVEEVDYSALRATTEARPSPRMVGEPGSFWEEILRATLTGRRLAEARGDPGLTPEAPSAAGVASLIQAQLKEEEVGSVAGRLTGVVAQHLETARGPARAAAAHRIAELLRVVPAEIRDRLLARATRVLATEEGDDAVPALETLSSAIPNGAMALALRRLKSEGFGLSAHAQRMLQALATPPRAEAAVAEPTPAGPLVRELAALLRDEDVDRFNPPDHSALLDQASIELPAPVSGAAPSVDAGHRLDTLMDEQLTDGMADMLVELLDRGADFESLRGRVEGTFRALLGLARLERAAELAEMTRSMAVDPRRPPQVRLAAEACLAALTGAEHIPPLVDALQQTSASAAAAAQRLLEALGPAVIRGFLLALAEETDKTRRRRLLDLLGAIGLAIVPDATRLLSDPRWYVVRNMVLLLRTVGDRSSLDEVRRLAGDPDIRVRLEAIKSLLEFDAEHSRELLERAINDANPELSEAAVELTGLYGIAEAREPLLALLQGWDILGRRRSVRLKALGALGDLGDPAVLPRLRRFFKERWLPLVSLEERRAAFRSLEVYPLEARRPWVERGLRSRDALIRSICWRIFRIDAAAPSGGERLV